MSDGTITVVGIGADGWDGLAEPGRRALRDAAVVHGATRQLELLPRDEVAAERRPWPSPMEPALDALVADPSPAAVLASGDPLVYGVGGSLVRRGAASRLDVIPHPSAFALACARMRWSQEDTTLVSAVAAPLEVVARHLQPGRRLVVFTPGRDGAAQLARALVDRGFGESALAVLEQLGGEDERRRDVRAHDATRLTADALHCVALAVQADRGTPVHGTVAGLADEAYVHEGQLTKRHVRAITLAALAPLPGQLLWDVGGGSGSIGIEWLRAESSARAVAIESRPDRAERVAQNAARLGVPQLRVVTGRAPEALHGLEAPAAVFIGGGITMAGLIEHCWDALPPGGRLVANTVTLEGERTVGDAQQRLGGSLTRIEISRAEPVGGFTGWRAQMPVVQWVATR